MALKSASDKERGLATSPVTVSAGGCGLVWAANEPVRRRTAIRRRWGRQRKTILRWSFCNDAMRHIIPRRHAVELIKVDAKDGVISDIFLADLFPDD